MMPEVQEAELVESEGYTFAAAPRGIRDYDRS